MTPKRNSPLAIAALLLFLESAEAADRYVGYCGELETDVSLKDFKLKPPSVLLGTISVRDSVKVKAHVKLQKEPP